jgi:hypothetical protein
METESGSFEPEVRRWQCGASAGLGSFGDLRFAYFKFI